jgi:hypothetical protein
MALTRKMVQRMVAVAGADPVARERISSVLRILGKYSGDTRNMLMVLGDMVYDADTAIRKFVGSSPSEHADFYDPNGSGWGAQLQCNGIAEAAVAALTRRAGDFPNVKQFRLESRSEGFAHAAVYVETVDGGEYIVDWWMTLDVTNPMVFRYATWDAAESGGYK